MKYYSHCKENSDKTRYGSKDLIVHIEGVTQNALSAFYSHIELGENEAKIRQILKEICLYHDLGKYTPHFQHYLLGHEGQYIPELKQHAKFGGFCLYQKYLTEKSSAWAILAAYIIIHHHKSLTDFEEIMQYVNILTSCKGRESKKVFEGQLLSLQKQGDIEQIIHETQAKEGNKYWTFPEEKPFRKATQALIKQVSPRNYFTINYLFSLLIEGDKLDASDTKQHIKNAINPFLVEKMFGKPSKPTFEGALSAQHQKTLRDYVRACVMQQLEREDILTQKIFTLTAPTGIGKTLTALDFALRLKAMIKEKEGHEAQIIYALPFINIIEQAIKVYKEIIPETEGKTLAHYQFADVFGEVDKKEYSDDETEAEWNQRAMQLDTWQSDIVITTFVQFFQTLIGNRNKILKKFNHLAGAIVILDEVQTLRLEQIPLIGAMLFFLSKYLNTRILLMTATKPRIFELCNEILLKNSPEKAEALELLSDFEQVFAAFHRTQICPLIDRKIESNEDFLNHYFLAKWHISKSCLIVCNLVKRSLDVFETIKAYFEDNNIENPLFYLSTNIIPADRMKVIDDVKAALRAGLSPILVSTQSVEAGVDLDFDMGFRDLAPIDSMIQVAGRINRENTPERANAPLYIVDFDECGKIYDALTAQQAKNALLSLNKKEIPEEDYLQLIGGYFDNISNNSSFDYARKHFEGILKLVYHKEEVKKEDELYPVSKFQIIEYQNYGMSIFIEKNEKAKEAKEMFLKMIHKKFEKHEFEKYKLTFHQHIITVPKYLVKAKELIALDRSAKLCEGIYIVKEAELTGFYDEITGFNRTQDTEFKTLSF